MQFFLMQFKIQEICGMYKICIKSCLIFIGKDCLSAMLKTKEEITVHLP